VEPRRDERFAEPVGVFRMTFLPERVQGALPLERDKGLSFFPHVIEEIIQNVG